MCELSTRLPAYVDPGLRASDWVLGAHKALAETCGRDGRQRRLGRSQVLGRDNGPMAERTVNARQREVLNWIVEGCPEGVMTGTDHKTTAKALHRRRLAVVSGRGGIWKAEATDAGRYFAQHGQYPAGHWSATSGQRSRSARSHPHDRSGLEDRRRVTGRRPVDQLIADLVEAGGELTVEAYQDRYWEGLASSAIRYNKIPVGKVLKVERGATWKERIIRLEDARLATPPDPEFTADELGPFMRGLSAHGPPHW